QFLVPPVALAPLHRRLRRDQRAVAPFAQAGSGEVELTGEGLEGFAAQQAGHRRQLAPSGEAALRPGIARAGAGASVLGARRRPLGVVAADLVQASALGLRWHLPQPAVSSNRAAPQFQAARQASTMAS